MIGKTIGPYQIIEELGQGGMGVVYKAVHTTLEQKVAIKALSSELSRNQSSRNRFIKEAKIQAKFSHPNVVNIFNYLELGEDVYIVMEYVDGQTIGQKLRHEGVISEKEAISISISVLQALEFMHSQGVVHRDIKPSNIMITNTGLIKVTDFGIAKVVDDKTQQTKTGIVGSVNYISPEQILGENTGAATDVYSYGATLFHMITGRALYDGTEYTIMRSHLEGNPIPPWELNDKISKNLGGVVLKSVQKAPRDRYKSARAFSDDLKKIERGENISVPFPAILKDYKQRIHFDTIGRKHALYGGFGILLLLSIITFAFNRESEQKNSSPNSANTILLDADVDKTKTVQQEVQVISPEPKPIAKTNIDNSSEKPIQPNEEVVIDDRFILFDEDLYNEKNAKEIEERNKQLEEQNKKLEEKLREEQKRYEARSREARKREQELKSKEDKRRRQEEKQNGGIKNSYKKVYHPVKKNVFRPIKKGFNKIKDKID